MNNKTERMESEHIKDVVRRVKPETYRLEMDHLPDEFVQKAEKELNETPATREKALKDLRKLIERECNLSNSWMNDSFLLMFLRCGKFDVHRAFLSLKTSVTFMRTHGSYFNVKQYILDIFIREKIFYFLPYRDSEGCAICVVRFDIWNPTEAPADDCLAAEMLFLLTTMSYPMTQVNGLKLLLDVTVNGVNCIRCCTPHNARFFYQMFQVVVPARIKAVHILNPSILFKMFWTFASKMLSDKLKSRFILHKDLSELQHYFPVSIIPVSLGGQLEDHDISEWVAKTRYPEIVHQVVGRNKH